MKVELLNIQNVSKSFPGVKALNNVSFNVLKGEVLSIVGENGAGKSTLMKILSGVETKDSGKIYFEGKEVVFENPLDAQHLGISIIHQELNVMPNLSVMENVFMGREYKYGGVFVDKNTTYEKTQQALAKVELDIDPEVNISKLSIAQQQMVEIARALTYESKLIIMDEPTSSLTQHETEVLLGIIKKLRDKGVSIIFISHKLEEVFEISNRVTVIRDGNVIQTENALILTKEMIVSMMVGREIDNIYPKSEPSLGREMLRVENVSTKDLLRNISFDLKAGEILGFSGLVGSGRTELMEVIFGMRNKTSGNIFIEDKAVDIKHPQTAIDNRIAFVSEDRKSLGLVLGMTIRENITLSSLGKVSRSSFISNRYESWLSDDYIEMLQIKTPSGEQIVRNLSGGNQQKVVVSKWLATKPSILILDEPTRGIDVGAKKEIHSIINDLAQEGMAVILVSSDLPEVIGMSDRVVVMHEGQIKGVLGRDEVNQETIMSTAIYQ